MNPYWTVFYGLKGQSNSAQGNPGETGSRPGFMNGSENRPRIKVDQNEIHIPDEMGNLNFRKLTTGYHAVRKKFFALILAFLRTGGPGFSITQGVAVGLE